MDTFVTERKRMGLVDVLVFIGLVALGFVAVKVVRGMTEGFSLDHQPEVSLALGNLPHYAARSWVRMMVALAASFVFSIAIGYLAAKNRTAEKLIVPALDILQSVPILSFLTFTAPLFLALLPGSLLGLEAASIFVIFTSQVWNMTYAFYHSLITAPAELDEVVRVYRLGKWHRFLRFELPHTAMPLIWNAMLSISGGWFFLVASELITVGNQKVHLPGLGSYIGLAIEAGNWGYAAAGIAAILITIVATTVFITRPLVVWSQKFKYEQEAGERPSHFILGWLERSAMVRVYSRWIGRPMRRALDWTISLGRAGQKQWATVQQARPEANVAARWIAVLVFLGLCVYGALVALEEVERGFDPNQFWNVVGLGMLTLGRVTVVVIISSIIWVPIGVWIGLQPKVAEYAQPIIAVLAAFPMNCVYPIAIGLLGLAHFPNWGSILLLALGAQWYLLFNIIAYASRIPSDLREASRVLRLTGWTRWKTLILPAVFPGWITGALTAAGGAWNASIVAEVASWGGQKLEVNGLGRYIADAFNQQKPDWPALIVGTAVMTLFVVGINRLLWQPLSQYAEKRFTLE